MKKTFRKAAAFILCTAMIGSMVPLSASAATVSDNGEYEITFNNGYQGGTIDGVDEQKIVRFNFDSDDEVIDLAELVGNDVKCKYYTLKGWWVNNELSTTVKKSDFGNSKYLYMSANFDTDKPRNSGKYYLDLDFGLGRTDEYDLTIREYNQEASLFLEFSADDFEEITLPIPTTTDGAEFVGWLSGGYYGHDTGNQRPHYVKITAEDFKNSYYDVIDLDATYKKKATENDTTYVITLDANGGTIDGKERESYVRYQTSSYSPQDISLYIPENEDETLKFKGWNTKQDGSGYIITHTGFINHDFEEDGRPGWCDVFEHFGDENKNVTLYAKWVRDAVYPETDSEMDSKISELINKNIEKYKVQDYNDMYDEPETADLIIAAADSGKKVTVGFVLNKDNSETAAQRLEELKKSWNINAEDQIYPQAYDLGISIKADGKEIGRVKYIGRYISNFNVTLPSDAFEVYPNDVLTIRAYSGDSDEDGDLYFRSLQLSQKNNTCEITPNRWVEADDSTMFFVGSSKPDISAYSDTEGDKEAADVVAGIVMKYRADNSIYDGDYYAAVKEQVQKATDAYQSGKKITARFVVKKIEPTQQQIDAIAQYNNLQNFNALDYYRIRLLVYADGELVTKISEYGSSIPYNIVNNMLNNLPEEDPRYTRKIALYGVSVSGKGEDGYSSSTSYPTVKGNKASGSIPQHSGIEIYALGYYQSGDYSVSFGEYSSDVAYNGTKVVTHPRIYFNFLSDDEQLGIKDFFGFETAQDMAHPYAKFIKWQKQEYDSDKDEYVYTDISSVSKSEYTREYYSITVVPIFDQTVPKNSGTYYITVDVRSGDIENLPTLGGKITWQQLEEKFSVGKRYVGTVKSSDFTSITIPTPVFEGKELIGWNLEFDSDTGTLKTHSATITKDDFANSDAFTLAAEYKAPVDIEKDKTGMAILDANGGLIYGNEIGYYHSPYGWSGIKYSMNYLLPERAGYKFLGWNTKKDGSGVTVDDIGMASMSIFSKYHEPVVCDDNYNVKLYAQWKKISTELENLSTVSSLTVEIGDKVQLNAKAEGGSGGYTYALLYKKHTSSSWISIGTKYGTVTKGTFTPGAPVQYDVMINVKDSAGTVKSKKFIVNVLPKLTNTSTIVTKAVTANNPVVINASAQGGTGIYTYTFEYKKSKSTAWTAIKENNIDGNNASFVPTASADYDVRVTVSDSAGYKAEKVITVNAAEKLKNNSTISGESVCVGDTVTLNAAASGGTGEYTYALMYKKSSSTTWTKIGTKYGTASTGSFTPTKAVAYDVMINVKDSTGTVASKTFTLNVTKSLVNNSTINADTVTVGNKVVMKGAASGGAGSYTYSFYYKKSKNTAWTAISENTAKSAAFKPASAVSYDCKVVVTDANGATKEKLFTVNAVK